MQLLIERNKNKVSKKLPYDMLNAFQTARREFAALRTNKTVYKILQNDITKLSPMELISLEISLEEILINQKKAASYAHPCERRDHDRRQEIIGNALSEISSMILGLSDHTEH